MENGYNQNGHSRGATAPSDPDTIRSNIEQSRSDLNQTLAAIEEKLSPSQLIRDLWTQFMSSDGKRGNFSRVMDGSPASMMQEASRAIRENPIPCALIGIGALALVRDAGPSVDEMSEHGRSLKEKGVQVKSQAEARARERGGVVQSKAREVKEAMESRGQALRDKGQSHANQARASMEGRQRSARAQVDGTLQAVRERVDGDPVVLGALGVALGAALGALDVQRSRS